MISHPALAVEPWSVHETALSLDHLARTESLFALSNGHIGVRGNLDEGEPHGLPGTYLNGPAEIVVQSELVANESIPLHGKDPRAAVAVQSPLEPEHSAWQDSSAILVHRTRRSGLRIAAQMDHIVTGSDRVRTKTEATA